MCVGPGKALVTVSLSGKIPSNQTAIFLAIGRGSQTLAPHRQAREFVRAGKDCRVEIRDGTDAVPPVARSRLGVEGNCLLQTPILERFYVPPPLPTRIPNCTRH